MARYIMVMTLGLAVAACSSSPERETRTGAQLFANHCAACHGTTAEGDGPVAGLMKVNVPNLRALAERNGGSFPLADVRAYIDGRELPASHGDRQMPVWGDIFGWGSEGSRSERLVEQRIDAIVAYIAMIQY